MAHAAYFVMAAYVCVGHSFVQRFSNYKKAQVRPANIHMLQVSHLDNQLNRFTLLRSSPKTLINWLQANNNFLASSMQCDQCRADCVLNGQSWSTDRYTWRCKSCHEVSIRKYSFFSKSHLYIPDIYSTSLIICNYADGYSLWRCAANSALYRSEEGHIYLRLLTALEMIENQSAYTNINDNKLYIKLLTFSVAMGQIPHSTEHTFCFGQDELAKAMTLISLHCILCYLRLQRWIRCYQDKCTHSLVSMKMAWSVSTSNWNTATLSTSLVVRLRTSWQLSSNS